MSSSLSLSLLCLLVVAAVATTEKEQASASDFPPFPPMPRDNDPFSFPSILFPPPVAKSNIFSPPFDPIDTKPSAPLIPPPRNSNNNNKNDNNRNDKNDNKNDKQEDKEEIRIEYEVKNPADDCKFELDGETFDFTPLRLPEGANEYASSDPSRNQYRMNICGVNPSPASDCQRANGMICQYGGFRKDELEGVVARWSAQPYPVWSYIDDGHRDAGVKLDLMNGDDCIVRGMKKPRESIIFFPCDPSAGKMGSITVQETTTCTYVFTIPTELACGGSAGMGSGWLFVLLTFLCGVAYFGLGYVYNHYKCGKNGAEAIPNVEFWKDLPALVKDGCVFTYAKTSALLAKKDKLPEV